MRIASIALFSALTLLAFSAPANAANDVWDGNFPNMSDFRWGTGANWVDNTTPGLSDTATFNQTTGVIFAANPTAIQGLTVSAGNVLLTSSGGTRTLNVNSASGGQDVLVTNSASLTLGVSAPLHLTAGDDLTVQNGATLNVNVGSNATINDLFVIGGGQVIVDGSDSLLLVALSAAVGNDLGGVNTLTVRNGATGFVQSSVLPLNVGVSANAATTGILNVESGAEFNRPTLNIGTGAAGAGTVNVNGNGSTLLMSASNAPTNIGSASGGVGTLNIGTTASGAAFGTSTLTINATGVVNIGSETTSGTLSTNGDIMVNGGRIILRNGQLHIPTSAVFRKTMTVQNGGQVDMQSYFTGLDNEAGTFHVTGAGSRWEGESLRIEREVEFNVTAGGQLNVTHLQMGQLAFDNPTLVVDGAGSTVTCSTGVFGGAGVGSTTFRNNASGTFTGGISMFGSLLSVQSGADLIANGISLDQTTSLFVTGAGSTVTLTPGSNLSISGSELGTAFFTLDDNAQFTVGPDDTTTVVGTDDSVRFDVRIGATFTTGNLIVSGPISSSGGVIQAGTLTLNPTGKFYGDPSGSGFVTDHLIFNSGTGSAGFNGLPPLDITINQAITLQNGAHLSFASGFTTQDNIVYTVTGAGSTIETLGASTFTIDGGAQMIVTSGGLLSATADLVVGNATTGTGTVNIATGGTLSTGTTGGMTILATGTVNVGTGANVGTLNANGDVTIDGGTLTRGDHAAFNFAAERTMTIQNGGLASFTGNYTTTSDAIYNITGAGSLLEVVAGNLIVNNGAQVNLNSSGTVDVSGAVIVTEEGTLQTGASVNDPIVGTSFDATINVIASGVSLGSAASFNGFNHQGVLNVGANTATLNSAGYVRLGVLTTLAGGTINAPNGVYLSGGGNLVGNGAVNARITGDSGSLIEANGALALGDAASPAGFNYGGELRTRQFAVTLNSSAQAGLGNLTTLGNGANAGTLNATNGYFIDFAEALTGFGTVNSTNTLVKRSVINGTVEGNSAAQPITLSGYIKGVGSFNNVTFTGTFDPGLSPTLSTVGSITLGATNTLIIELGGTSRGSQYDAILASGTLSLDGNLSVVLINGFSPVAGNSFDILDWASPSGTFDVLSLPALTSGLMWNASQLYTLGTLIVALAGDYNLDGAVDAADYVVWRKTGINGPLGYDIWRSHFGQTAIGSSSGAGTNSAVPEPATLVTLIMAVVGICMRRRHFA